MALRRAATGSFWNEGRFTVATNVTYINLSGQQRNIGQADRNLREFGLMISPSARFGRSPHFFFSFFFFFFFLQLPIAYVARTTEGATDRSKEGGWDG